MLYTNQDAKIMEGLRIEAYQIGTSIKTTARGRYETVKSGAWKTWNVNPHVRTKGGVNKDRRYTSTNTPGEYRNTTSER